MAQIQPTTEALRLLAGCTSRSTDVNDIFKTLGYFLDSFTIEMPDRERAFHLVQQTGASKLEHISLFIRYFVCLSSNNVLVDDVAYVFVDRMVGSKTHWVLDPLLDLRTPITDIFGSNIFVCAAGLGAVDAVHFLIARGIDVDAAAGVFSRRTALEEAVNLRHLHVVELLLNAGADPKNQVLSEHSLLYSALGGDHGLEILKMLVNKGADVNAVQDRLGRRKPLLVQAVHLGDYEIMRFLLEAGANVNAFDTFLGTALRTAAAEKDIEAVQILIDAGAEIDAPTGDLACEAAEFARSTMARRTPIQQASLTGNTEIVQLLVREGADVNAFLWTFPQNPLRWEGYGKYQRERYDRDAFWDPPPSVLMTPLQAAVLRENAVIVRMLLFAGAHVDAKGYGDTPFQMAAAMNQAKIMQILLRHGADVNAPAADERGMTALQVAAGAGNSELVRNLLDSGSKINAAASPSEGRTALQAAAENGNVDLAKILIRAGADVNADASPKGGRTCLQAAVEHRHVEMVFMLLNEGADVNASAATISGGLTALQAALWPFDKNDRESDVRSNEQYQNAIFETLINAGADYRSPSSPQEGIVGAVLSKRHDLVRWCLLRGADPNSPAGRKTALGAAVLQGSDQLVTLLLNEGADVNGHCEMYPKCKLTLWTALHVAAWTGRIEIANLLLQAGAEINMPLPRPGIPTALQSAIAGNRVAMVQFLLIKGADPNAFGAESRETCSKRFHNFVHMEILNALAIAGGDFNRIINVYELDFHGEVIQKALDSGALMHWTAEQKGHLLLGPAQDGYTEQIEAILDAGADVNAPAAHYCGRTALQMAADWGQTDAVILLLSKGADVNAPAAYHRGMTALQGAATDGSPKMAFVLLEAGAEINAAPAVEHGMMALEAAAAHGRLDIISLLLKNDHDVEGMELRCELAALLAESAHHKVIARVLREHRADQDNTQ